MDEWYLRCPDGCQIYVAELGEGPETVVVVHGGFGSEHSYLVPPVERLGLPHRFVFYDQRGSLRSPAPLETVSVDQHLADLALLLARLDLDGVWLFGHSMGTFLSMMYGAQDPGCVSGMVLVSPILPVVPLPAEFEEAQAAHVDAWQKRRERAVAEELRRLDLDRDGLSDREATWRSRIEFGGLNLSNVGRWRELSGGGGAFVNVEAGEKAGSTLPSSWDLRAPLSGVGSPISVILGDSDWTAPEVCRELFSSVASAGVEVVGDAGHYVWIDQPLQFRMLVSRAFGREAAQLGDGADRGAVTGDADV